MSDRSIATVCLSGTLDEKLVAAATAGFDAVELFEPDLIAAPQTPAEIRQRAEDLGLEIAMYQPFRDFEAVPEDMFKENLRRAESKFALMRELGAPTLLVCSSVSPHALDDDELAGAQLRALAERAEEHGLRIAYEALAWGRHVSDYEHAWRIAKLGDHPSLGTCLDSFHILSRGSDPAGIRQIPAEKIFFLQLADAPRLVMDVLQWSRHYRCFPGQGGFDLAAFMAHVVAAGYQGPLSLEVFNDVFRQADPKRIAIDAMRSLLLLEDELAEGTLPSAADLHGYAFAELAVRPAGAADLERRLVSMGFRHAGQHRSKAVQLWKHGETRLLVNHEDSESESPQLAAIAIESADTERSAERARRLLSPPLPRERDPKEAELTAVAAPDGTSLFFCRTDAADPESWVDDFVSAEPPDSDANSGLLGIDHVALSQPYDYFDEAVLFYRSVLGLEPEEGAEFASPEGMIRGRAARNHDGTVRFALSVPLVGANQLELQHIAFACADIFETAEQMRGLELPILSISANYYDDLGARTALEPKVIERMQQLGILYDSSDSGEFFHFYTALAGSGLFFELLERRGAYEGYGAANSPVRMASQRPRH